MYLIDLLSKDSKIGITNFLTNITTRSHSHKGGWTKLLKCDLLSQGYKDVTILNKDNKLEDFDAIIIDLGAEFNGVINVFGGLNSKVFKRLEEWSTYSGKIFIWKNEFPDISIFDMRRNNNSTCQEFKDTPKDFIPKINEKLKKATFFNDIVYKSKLIIGDSHTPAVWDPSYNIRRRDGRTLTGMLKHGTIKKVVNEYTDKELDEVFIYAGNIDIRHHLCRSSDSVKETTLLANTYLQEAFDAAKQVKISELLPIENESRKLPKTGYYKGTPFYGKWSERYILVDLFNNILNKNRLNVEIHQHPEDFKNEKNELKFDVMERPASVHISPEHYVWNMDKNKRRYK